jgi:predicted neutral ceramidase superfamily lipid hydrolase
MWFNYIITDFTTFESDAVALEVEEHDVRVYGVRLAKDVLKAMPELTNMGVCVVVYDTDEQPVSIVPFDPIQ